MSYFTTDTSRYNGLLQGDIFRIEQGDDIFLNEERYVVLLTADCDMAHESKGVEFLTFLPVISSMDFVKRILISDFFNKKIKKIHKEIITYINSEISKVNTECNPINEDGLINWLEDEDLESILHSLNLINIPDNIKSLIEMHQHCLNNDHISSYAEIKKIEGVKKQNVFKDILSSLTKPKEEYFILPLINELYEQFSVVKIRMIKPIHRSRVFTNEMDYLASCDKDNVAVIRVGRLSDYLRYSISQKFSHLFNKIGMPTEFESDRDTSIEMLMDILKEEK